MTRTLCLISRTAPYVFAGYGVTEVADRTGLVSVPWWVWLLLFVPACGIGFLGYLLHQARCRTCRNPQPAEGPTVAALDLGAQLHHGQTWILRIGYVAITFVAACYVLDWVNLADTSGLLAATGWLVFVVIGADMWVTQRHNRSWCPICRPENKPATVQPVNDVERPGTL
ncbi:hypothetical protein [Nocardia abscessus]|uniref:hypothetical protein n=1 Tax=Nocardia abscessus TaxID=120957 RepID=UPI00245544C1|nr:hypothetical protein [Nocardia abscessus]